MDAIRRLATGESEKDVALALKVDQHTVSQWMQDPLFASELRDFTLRIEERILKGAESKIADVIKMAAANGADLCYEAVTKGTVGNTTISPALRMQSAWDALDRAGFGRTAKHLITDNPADLMVEAYRRRQDENAKKGLASESV
jgi:hypothetical protein